MRHPTILKQKAQKLRMQGNSLGEISKILNIAKSTASLWLRDYPKPRRSMRFNRKQVGAVIRIVVGSPPKKKSNLRNGDYLLVEAPKKYPGEKYRKKYAYEHHVVFWEQTGRVPNKNECIHHKNHNRHDNRFENLKLMSKSSHARHHAMIRGSLKAKPSAVTRQDAGARPAPGEQKP